MKTSYPTDDYFLYYSGNEGARPFRDHTRSPHRAWHRAKGTGLPGADFYEPLREATLRAGAQVHYASRVSRLITDSTGNVLGG
ncbi:MAG: hypothetical protein R3A47_05295 [Polyangiales bacterium]